MNLRHFNSNLIRKRLFVVLVIIVLFFILAFSRQKAKNCFANYSFNDGKTLADVSDNTILIQHKSSKNIFFHETSCNPGKKGIKIKRSSELNFVLFLAGIISLTPRQACAIESSGN